jgi:hypothetical protein
LVNDRGRRNGLLSFFVKHSATAGGNYTWFAYCLENYLALNSTEFLFTRLGEELCY